MLRTIVAIAAVAVLGKWLFTPSPASDERHDDYQQQGESRFYRDDSSTQLHSKERGSRTGVTKERGDDATSDGTRSTSRRTVNKTSNRVTQSDQSNAVSSYSDSYASRSSTGTSTNFNRTYATSSSSRGVTAVPSYLYSYTKTPSHDNQNTQQKLHDIQQKAQLLRQQLSDRNWPHDVKVDQDHAEYLTPRIQERMRANALKSARINARQKLAALTREAEDLIEYNDDSFEVDIPQTLEAAREARMQRIRNLGFADMEEFNEATGGRSY